jgi:hypothetical protein
MVSQQRIHAQSSSNSGENLLSYEVDAEEDNVAD